MVEMTCFGIRDTGFKNSSACCSSVKLRNLTRPPFPQGENGAGDALYGTVMLIKRQNVG